MSDAKNDIEAAPEEFRSKDLRPLYIFAAFLLLGAALALVLFGSDLLNSSASGGSENSAQSLLDQVSELSELNIEPAGSDGSNGFIEAGDQALDFTLLDLDGNSISLSDYKGRPVIMNLWATWCAPCRIEMPALQDAVERYEDEGLAILALNQAESAEVAGQYFYDEMGLTFTPLLDENSSVAASYGGMNVLPTTYFIDQEGEVSAVHRGPLTPGQIDGYLSATINN